jgi:hypothetical protein
MSDRQFPRVLTYTGRQPLVNGKLGYVYAFTDEVSGDERELVHTKPLVSASVGSQITMYYADESRTSFWAKGPNAPALSGVHSNEDEVRAWRASDRAYAQQHANKAKLEKLAKDQPDPFLDSLSAAREDFRKLKGIGQRAALMSYVEAYLLS